MARPQTHNLCFTNYVIQVMRLLWNWGKERGWTKTNPFEGIPKIKPPATCPKRNRRWSTKEVTCVLSQAQGGLLIALALGYYAGMRLSDALKFTWAGYDGQSLKWTAQKNKEDVWTPVPQELKDILDETPRTKSVVVLNTRGKPYTEDGFRSVFYRFIKS